MTADAAQFIAKGLCAIGAGIAILTAIGPGLSEGKATATALEAISRNPEAYKQIRGTLLTGLAMTETSALYGLLVAIFIIVFGIL